MNASPAFALAGAPAPVAQTIAAQHLPPNSVSFVIIDPDSGRLVAGQNIDTPRSPASTIKVVTTFASLDLLGPAYVWHTRALIRGALNNGVLDGDLVLQGGGDPYMTLERDGGASPAPCATRGLRTIRGDIVIDDTAFAASPRGSGGFRRAPNRSYNVLPDALMVNFQSIDFPSGAEHGCASSRHRGDPDAREFDHRESVALASGRCGGASASVNFEVASERWDRVVFSGALAPSCAERDFAGYCCAPRITRSAPSCSCGAN